VACSGLHLLPKPLRGVFEVEKIHAAITLRHNFYAGIRDATRQAYMVTRSRHHQLLDEMKYAHFPQLASGSTYIHVEPIPDSWNFKLKKQVELTTALTQGTRLHHRGSGIMAREVRGGNEDHPEVEAPLSRRRGNSFRGRDRRVHSRLTTSQGGDSCTSNLRRSQQ
jgi:hypothetical protein